MFNVGHDPKFKKSNKVFLLVFFICYTVFLTTGLPTKDIYKWQYKLRTVFSEVSFLV